MFCPTPSFHVVKFDFGVSSITTIGMNTYVLFSFLLFFLTFASEASPIYFFQMISPIFLVTLKFEIAVKRIVHMMCVCIAIQPDDFVVF